ncbi:MAG: hypothetical protein EOO24_60260, partial [Comamonadaceae bacterium]
MATALLPARAAAQALPGASRDTLVKAAFLHKFASFVEWPDGAFARASSVRSRHSRSSPSTPMRSGVSACWATTC